MSEELERRYRALLGMLPRQYRETRGEELLGTLMEGAGGARRWPEVREALSLAGLSIRTRLRPVGAGGAAESLFGRTARAVAFLGSAVLALAGVSALVMTRLVNHTLFAGFPEVVRTGGGGHALRNSVLKACYRELPGLWLVVFALLALGWWSAARILALGLAVFAVTDSSGVAAVAVEQLPLVVITAAAIVLTRGPDTRRSRGRAAWPAAAFVAGLTGVFAIGMADPHLWVNGNPARLGDRFFRNLDAGLWLMPDTTTTGVLTAALLALALVLALRSAAWSLAVAVVAAGVFGAIAALWTFQSIPFYLQYGGMGTGAAVLSSLLAIAGFGVLRERRAVGAGGPEGPLPAG